MKSDTMGRARVWHIEQEEHQYRMVSGVKDGKLTTSEWTTAQGVNEGRANATTPLEQAMLEIRAAYTKKRKQGYAAEGERPVEIIRPMLAKDFNDYQHLLTFGAGTRVFSQPKLDGIRCIVTKDGMFSRNGEPIVSCPHILEQLRHSLSMGAILDGELYNHLFRNDFNKISSLVRQTNCTEMSHLQSAGLVEYHVYDLVDPSRLFSERITILQRAANHFGPRVRLVPTRQIDSREFLDITREEYMMLGYEGQMVRLDRPYELKRTDALLKRKEMQDAEFEIIGVEEGLGNRSGMAGGLVLSLGDGRCFRSNLRGGYDLYKSVLKYKHLYIGKKATVTFQNYTPDGIPRFPVVKDIDRRDA